jgi:hypothetical protein
LDAAARRTTRERLMKGFIAVNVRAAALCAVPLAALYFAGVCARIALETRVVSCSETHVDREPIVANSPCI